MFSRRISVPKRLVKFCIDIIVPESKSFRWFGIEVPIVGRLYAEKRGPAKTSLRRIIFSRLVISLSIFFI